MTLSAFSKARKSRELWREVTSGQVLHLTARLDELTPADFRELESLQRLTIGPELDEMRDPITQATLRLRPFLFAELPELRELRLLMKGITCLPRHSFYGLESLTVLDLSGNRIEAIEPGAFDGVPCLTTLRMEHNRLQNLPPQCFAPVASLQCLNLDGNQIDRLEADTFAPLTELMSLSLAGNRLRNLEPGSLRGLERLGALNLLGNPLGAAAVSEFRHLSPHTQISVNLTTGLSTSCAVDKLHLAYAH